MFHKQQYKDGEGKTPSDYLCDFLDSNNDPEAALGLSTYIMKISQEGGLFGVCLCRMEEPPVQIWVYSKGPYHLMYSYFSNRNEVCFLNAFNGDPEAKLTDAKQRVKNFYP